MKRSLRLTASVTALTLAALACTAPAEGERDARQAVEPARGGGVVVGVVGEPPTLDPYSPLASGLTYALVRPLWPSLLRFAPDGSIRLDLAARLTEVAGGVRVELRPAFWSNADPITARDVVASAARARPPSGFAGIEARAVDGRTVELTGNAPDWRTRLARVAFVLPQGRARLGVSGGPFTLSGRTPGLELRYRRNPRWYGAGAFLDSLTVRFARDSGILLGLLDKGRIDVAAPPSSVNLDDRLDALGVTHEDALGWERLYLDLSGTSMTRAERVTLWRGLERSRVEEGFVRDDGRSATTLHPAPGKAGATGAWAGRLGRGAPPPEGSVEMAASEGDELAQLVQRALFRQLEAHGFAVELLALPPKDFYGRRSRRDPPDVAIRRAAGAPGAPPSRRAFRRLSALPLFHVESVLAWREGIVGPAVNPTYEGALWNADRWWREAAD